jgi:hypothetical protein
MKRNASVVVACMGAAVSSAQVARAQCQGQWVNSSSGFGGVVNAMVAWDPDGGGPAAPVLVAGWGLSRPRERALPCTSRSGMAPHGRVWARESEGTSTQ